MDVEIPRYARDVKKIVEASGVENTVILIFSDLHSSGWRLKWFVYA